MQAHVCDERFASNTELNAKKTFFCVHHTGRPLHILEMPRKRVAFAAVLPGGSLQSGSCNPVVASSLVVFAQLCSYIFDDEHLLGAHESIPYRLSFAFT